MNVPPIGVPAVPIPLVASVGGPWTVRNITPIVDRVELKFGRTTRSGKLDMAAMATVTHDELRGMVDEVHAASADIPVGLFLLVAVGDGPDVAAVKGALGDNLCGRFAGEAGQVLDNLRALAQHGIGRVQITELVRGSIGRLGEELRDGRR